MKIEDLLTPVKKGWNSSFEVRVKQFDQKGYGYGIFRKVVKNGLGKGFLFTFIQNNQQVISLIHENDIEWIKELTPRYVNGKVTTDYWKTIYKSK